mmetsp:Transcript_1698/g.4033  ORF Transcript_1698/g.4033 Transcript_1698/m.4033 type:complete len:257 (+) Transcript_1698:112-882(+)|eukprot:CAMPEP_0178515242 /NCGR_PEP_ID=MMETSP0696-20121128/24451_1 /TAXON_ID=265572 /ORGANISM="Extubocellulus spinifer, Strain CCMP396" /LENGTH=256 /DNA_ID=CAMNT_0020145389 /DNA_START=35 /DNA_END=805 /DNA_ORIENTATION=-
MPSARRIVAFTSLAWFLLLQVAVTGASETSNEKKKGVARRLRRQQQQRGAARRKEVPLPDKDAASTTTIGTTTTATRDAVDEIARGGHRRREEEETIRNNDLKYWNRFLQADDSIIFPPTPTIDPWCFEPGNECLPLSVGEDACQARAVERTRRGCNDCDPARCEDPDPFREAVNRASNGVLCGRAAVRFKYQGEYKRIRCDSSEMTSKADRYCYKRLWNEEGFVWDACCGECEIAKVKACDSPELTEIMYNYLGC